MAFNKSHIVVLDAATMRGPLLRPKFAHRWTNTRLAIPKKQHGASKRTHPYYQQSRHYGERHCRRASLKTHRHNRNRRQ